MAVAIALLHLTLAVLAFNPAPHVGGDNGAYVALARSLLERGDYVELWDPALTPHTQYPPVFPAILALGMLAGLEPWARLALLGLVFSAAAAGISYAWMRRVTSPGVALGAGLLLACAPGTLALSHSVLSDVPFWTFTALALLGFSSADRPPSEVDGATTNGRREWGWIILAVVATTLALLTRSAGLPLVVAATGWLAMRRRWKALAALAAAAAPPWLLWTLRGQRLGAPGYLDQLRQVDPYQPALGTLSAADLAEQVGENLASYLAEHLPRLLLGWGGTAAATAFGVLLTALALAGWARRLRRPGVADLFLPVYVGLLLVWPAPWSGERFLLPLAPVLLLFAGEALRDGAAAVRLRPLAPALVALVLAMALPAVIAQVGTGRACMREYRAGETHPCMSPVWHDLLGVAEEARGRLPAGSVVLSRKPALFYVTSGYRGRLYPLSAAPDSFFAVAARAGAGFVVVDQVPDLAPLYLHPVLLERRDDFCVVAELVLPQAALARIDTAGPPRPLGSEPNAFRSCPLELAGP